MPGNTEREIAEQYLTIRIQELLIESYRRDLSPQQVEENLRPDFQDQPSTRNGVLPTCPGRPQKNRATTGFRFSSANRVLALGNVVDDAGTEPVNKKRKIGN